MRIEIAETENRGRHTVWCNGEIICRSTSTPLCSAARVLLKRGADPDEVLEKVRRGSNRVDMKTRIGIAAKLTVRERDDGDAPFFTRYTEPPSEMQRRTGAGPDRPCVEMDRVD
jgi:hypothetical protein